MDESFHKTKKTYGRPSLYNCTLPPPASAFPLFFTPKNALRFLVYSLFLGTMVARGYLDSWTGLGTVASLLNNTKSILSFCHFAFEFL
jgi:hypothetical protein